MKKIIFVLLLTLGLILFQLVKKPISAQDSTDSSETVRQKVQEKVEQVLKSPRAYIGTITDKVESTIQIKNESGEIQQISVDASATEFVKASKGGTKDIKFTDLAIGDFIVAMGFSRIAGSGSAGKNESGVLDAKRILVTSPNDSSSRNAYIGIVSDVSKNTFTLKTLKEGKTITVKAAERARITINKDGQAVSIKFSDVKEENTAIVVGVLENDVLTARRIHVISVQEKSPSPTPKI